MIHGTACIVIKYNNVEYKLEESIMTDMTVIKKQLVIESDISSRIKKHTIGKRLKIDSLYNVYKNDSFISQFNLIYALDGLEVKLKLADGKYFVDNNGDEANFIMDISPKFYNTKDFKEYFLISFESTNNVDLIQSALSVNQMFSEIKGGLFPLTDEDGNLILSE